MPCTEYYVFYMEYVAETYNRLTLGGGSTIVSALPATLRPHRAICSVELQFVEGLSATLFHRRFALFSNPSLSLLILIILKTVLRTPPIVLIEAFHQDASDSRECSRLFR